MWETDRIFFSYHHEDRAWLDSIKQKLEQKLDDESEVWADDELKAGDNWLEIIKERICLSNVGVFLASEGFFDSKFIKQEELGPLLQRYDKTRGNGQDRVRLLFVPIGKQGAERFEKSAASKVQAVTLLDSPLAVDPGNYADAQREEKIATVVRKIRLALDEPRVLLEEKAKGYEIEHRLSRAYWTRTYLAREKGGLKRQVVIKTVTRNEGLWRFYKALHDVRDITDLQNVVRLYDVDLRAKQPYYVMRFVNMGSLRSRLENVVREPWDSVQRILTKIARAVEVARYRKGIRHFYFDLKPSHVMIEGDDEQIEPFLSFIGRRADLRGSRLLDDLTKTCRVRNDLEEAMAYLLPEQFIAFQRSVNKEVSDVYLLGLLGCHMLEGRPSKQLDAEQLRSAIDGGRELKLRRFFEVGRLLKEPEKVKWNDEDFFRAVIDKMIALDPRYRFQSCAEALKALEEPRGYALQEVRRSYYECTRKPEFFERFYDDFFSACENARALFDNFGTRSANNKKWKRQKKLVQEASEHLFNYFEANIDVRDGSERHRGDPVAYFADRHKEKLDSRAKKANVEIDPTWFDQFIEILARTACNFDTTTKDLPEGDPIYSVRFNRWLQVLRPGANALRRNQFH